MAAAVTEKIMSPSPPPSQHMHLSPSTSRRGLDAASDTDALDRRPSLDLSSASSPSPTRLSDAQNQLFVKSEEYRQLFRLPPDEVLVQDFNCALQESFLLQGHMYLFGHYICFYSNLFGFETKKIIHFHEITSVRRAKAAAIFPTAIEIVAGEKKYFFTSFLSRDEAFKLINDGWLQHNGAAEESTDLEPKSDLNSQDSGIPEGTDSFRQAMEGVESLERNKDDTVQEDSKPLANGEFEIVSKPLGLQRNVEEKAVIVQSTDCSSSGRSSALKQEDSDAPRVPECFTLVAEAKFPVTVEKFFELFISDDGIAFQESFRRKCGDKDFKCTQWRPHEELGHSRNWSFQHPIKFYLGAKFGGCHEVQNYRFYRNRVKKQLDKARRSFLWEGNSEDHKFHLVKWSKVIMPEHQGGLGVRDLQKHNRSLLLKWWWRYAQENSCIWKKVVTAKYGKLDNWSTKQSRAPHGVGPWKYINSLKQEFFPEVYFKVGDGRFVKFWLIGGSCPNL